MNRLALLLAFAAPALAAPGSLAPPEVQERRGATVITSSGELPPGATGPLVARLRRGERTACETPLSVGDGGLGPQAATAGRVEVELLVSGRLLPGRYRLEVAPAAGGEALLATELAVGDEAAVRAAEASQAAWLSAAAGTLRDLTAVLEQYGRFRAALAAGADRDGAFAQAEQLRLWLEEVWRPAVRVAAMDLLTARRRVVLPPRPAAFEALGALLAAIQARGQAWESGVTGGKVIAPADSPELEARAGALLRELGHADVEARLASWRAGPLGQPAPLPPPGLAQGGTWEDPLGWRLEVPAGFQPEPQAVPGDRLTLTRPGCTVIVRVRELPDARDAAALTRAVETINWETLRGYKPVATTPLPDGRGVRIELTTDFAPLGQVGRPGRMVQVSLFPPGGGRSISLAVGWLPEEAPPPPELAQLEAGFSLTEPR